MDALLAALILADTGRRATGPDLVLVLDVRNSELLDRTLLEVPCTVTNRSGRTVVLAGVRFHFVSRVQYSLEPAESDVDRFHQMIWRYGCAEKDNPPFEERDFVEIPPGNSRSIGTVRVWCDAKPAGRYRLVGKYVFERPKNLAERYYPNDRIRGLFDRTLETKGIRSAAVEVTLP